MRIYDFDTEDEFIKIEMNLNNVKLLKNSIADYASEYRKFSRDINVDFRVLGDCIESYERALLIGVYTYAEQLVKNFYYELLEKDRTQCISINQFVGTKLDIEKFSPNVKYNELENSIKKELVPDFQFLIKKDRDEILKYNDIIKDRHRYAHRGIYQSSIEQYKDVINAEKFITIELAMVVEKGVEYRIRYQNDWKEIINLSKKCYGLYKQFKEKKHKQIKKQLTLKTKVLRNKSKQLYNKYDEYIDNCGLLEGVKAQLLRINSMDLRMLASFSILEDFDKAISDGKMLKG